MAFANMERLPEGVRHRDFLLHDLRRRWPKLFRVVVGKERGSDPEITRWCAEQPGRWYASPGREVYYFDNEKTALFFKMRWTGETR